MATPEGRILYIGNKLAKHGYGISVMETLIPLFENKFSVRSASDKGNKILRLLDMILSTVLFGCKADKVIIDTFSTSNFYYAFIVSQLCRVMGKSYLPFLHGGDLPKRLENSPKLSKMLFGNAFKNIAPSSYLGNNFKKYGFETIYIPNFIQIDLYPFLKREVLRPRLLYVRSFHEIYNPTMAIFVLQRLLRFFPQAELCMVGPDKDGSLGSCKNLVQKFGLEDKVRFTGSLKKEDWLELSSDYDVFINTTNFDNTPISVIEAMALGLPVVSTNVGGIPYLLSNGDDALLIPKGDIEAMVKSIVQLLDDSSLAASLSEAGRKKAESFDWDVVEKLWLAVLED